MNRRYDPDFKLEAVRLVVEEGRKARDVEESLGITRGVLKGWLAKYAAKKENAFIKGAGPLTLEEEVKRIHSAIGYMSPIQFEESFLRKAA